VASLAGGVGELVVRALAVAGEGRLALASHLIDWAIAVAPEDGDAHAARAQIYERRAREARALMTRGIFSAAAQESAAKSPPSPPRGEGQGEGGW